MSSKIISETFCGRTEPQWLLERPKAHQSHFDQRGCVRQIKSVSHCRLTENDLPASRSSRSRAGSYFPEQPSVVTADRQGVTVYNALPSVTQRTASNSSFYVPIVEFMVPLCCGKCEEKVKEELENDEGVYKVVCDLHNQRVTVSSSRDPTWLLQRIKRMKKNSHFWRGSTHFKDAHYLATSFPSRPKSSSSHHSHALLPQQHIDIDIPAYRGSAAPPPHHRTSNSPQRRYAAPRSPFYDDDRDRDYYYHHHHHRGAPEEYQYKSSFIASPYETSISYDDAQMRYDHATAATAAAASFRDDVSGLRHDHVPSSYGQPYATEDDALHLTGYY